jgi:hypothetical protein
MSTTAYPVHVAATLDPGVSRWRWLLKWLLVIPHYVVLVFLWAAFMVLSIVAFFAILLTGRYPRSIFEFDVGVLRWTWRVTYYAYGALGTDRYPPFSLAERPDYPAHLDIDYPERLSRGLVLVKWWLLAIPHYLVLGLFVGGAGYTVGEADGDGLTLWSTGLIGLLVLVAGVVLLFTGRYPRPVFDFVLGMNRWVLRVAAYSALMTDQYPPFRLDMGGDDPSAAVLTEPPRQPGGTGGTGGTAPTPPPTPPGAAWTAGRVVALVAGVLLLLVSLGLTASGAALAVADQAMRDDAGYLMSPDEKLRTDGYAIVSTGLEIDVDPAAGFVPDALLGTAALTATAGDAPVFVGVARTADAQRYLAGVRHAVVLELSDDPVLETTGTLAPVTPPEAQDFWVAASSGPGRQSVAWEPERGDWTLVVMNADARAGMDVDAAVGATVPVLGWAVAVLLSVGLTLLVVSVVVLAVVLRQAARAPRAQDSGV